MFELLNNDCRRYPFGFFEEKFAALCLEKLTENLQGFDNFSDCLQGRQFYLHHTNDEAKQNAF